MRLVLTASCLFTKHGFALVCHVSLLQSIVYRFTASVIIMPKNPIRITPIVGLLVFIRYTAFNAPFYSHTSSPAVVERPRDASCLLVVSFNSTIRLAQSSVISYFRFRLTAAYIKFCSVLISFGVFTDAWQSVP